MGAKIEARALAQAAGVPIIPGASEGDLARAAAQIGFPVMVKASAGGGGKGIRIVRSAGAFEAALGEARTEAMRSFGDDRMIVERCIERPRHVEVQVVGDRHGEVIHLGTRDCSSQRRFQKLVEEAPAPNLPAAAREGLTRAAVALARHIGYDNAGTVEFVVDADSGEFFFLEMNTRLQVEHPVTEAVTGLDLVELQLRAATGGPLGLAQDDVCWRGHSIEVRINAEDPHDGFTPRAGPVACVSVPDRVRWDTSVTAGSEVSPYYDPMLAKLIVTSTDRESALDELGAALDRLVLGPVPTNAGFLRWLIDQSALRAGDMTTNALDALGIDGLPDPPTSAEAAPAAAAAWLAHERALRSAAAGSSPWAALSGFRLTPHTSQAVVMLRDAAGQLHEVSAEAVAAAGDRLWATAVSTTREATSFDAAASTPANVPVNVPVNVAVNVAGHTVTFEVPERSDAWAADASAGAGSVNAITAPFPAVVVEVAVSIGAAVAAGDTIVVVEAMKMLHSLTASGAGIVADIHCHPGDAVEANQVLVSFQDATSS